MELLGDMAHVESHFGPFGDSANLDARSLRGNVYTAYTYEEKSFKVAEATDLSIRMEQTLVDASKIPADQLEIPERQAPWKHIKSNEHKDIQLVDDDPSKTALIGANLDPK
jgi:hypothetical protein